MVWDKLTGEPLHNAISNKMTLLLHETVTSNLIPALFPPYIYNTVLEGCCICNLLYIKWVYMSELRRILFAVWLDTRTKSTVDDFETKTTEKTREHVRVSVQ